MLDYLETDSDIDAIGHSRGGKTSLWAGATDPRFALVISNNSGNAGAALFRAKGGESIAGSRVNFPHWYTGNTYKLPGNETVEELPFDQHQLIALMAPRPVYVASAAEDAWADPEGEFLSCLYASPVWELWGRKGLSVEQQPPLDRPATDGYVAYHIRSGGHDLTPTDWHWYMDFADKRLK